MGDYWWNKAYLSYLLKYSCAPSLNIGVPGIRDNNMTEGVLEQTYIICIYNHYSTTL